MQIETLTIVGVGLIGGSIGLAARRHRLFPHILGVGRNPATLRKAMDVQAIDDYTTNLAEAAAVSSFLVFCTPVDQIVSQVLEAAPHCRPGTVITDAGSTKAEIVRQLEGRLPPGVHFVGSHPLAGSEKKGVEHARADLFQNRVTVITATEQTDEQALGKTILFWTRLGCEIYGLNPEIHDQALAMTSHLPHLLAAALAGILPEEWYPFTATGFRDTTRIAAGDPALWTAILAQNRVAMREALNQLTQQLTRFQAALDQNDTEQLMRLLSQGKQVRDALGN